MARIGRKKVEITKEPEVLTEENANIIRDAGEITISMIPNESNEPEEIDVNENLSDDADTDELEKVNEAEIESQPVKKQLNNSLQDFLY